MRRSLSHRDRCPPSVTLLARYAGWTLADVAAKRAMLEAHRIQHRCVSANVEGGYELADDEPSLVLRQLAATESAKHDFGTWE